LARQTFLLWALGGTAMALASLVPLSTPRVVATESNANSATCVRPVRRKGGSARGSTCSTGPGLEGRLETVDQLWPVQESIL